MPATTMRNDALLEQRRRSERFWERTVRAARLADGARQETEQRQRRLTELESNPPTIVLMPTSHRAFALAFPFLLAAAAFGEWVISVPAAEWLTLAVLGHPEWLPWTRLLLPAGIIAADLVAGYLRCCAAEDDSIEGFDARPILAWALLAVMSALSLATQLALRPADGAPPNLVQTYWVRSAALVGVTAALHALMIFGVPTLLLSLAYWRFVFRRARLARAIEAARHAQLQASEAALLWFNRYVRARLELTNLDRQAGPDPFDRTTREVLHGLLGYDPFAAQNALPAAPESASGDQGGRPSESPSSWWAEDESEVRS